MTVWLHTTILAAAAAATVAVGIASAAVLSDTGAGKRSDRLVADIHVSSVPSVSVVQNGDSLTVVTRAPAAE